MKTRVNTRPFAPPRISRAALVTIAIALGILGSCGKPAPPAGPAPAAPSADQATDTRRAEEAFSNEWYVGGIPSAATADGLSPETPYATVQAAWGEAIIAWATASPWPPNTPVIINIQENLAGNIDMASGPPVIFRAATGKRVTISGKLTVGAGASVILGAGITLEAGGRHGSGPVVTISNGALTLLDGAAIQGGWSAGDGGGVFVGDGGEFTMAGGVIRDNRAEGSGGGVFVAPGGSFVKTGGTLYGSEHSDNRNHVDGIGSAAYVAEGAKVRAATAEPSVNLSSAPFDHWDE